METDLWEERRERDQKKEERGWKRETYEDEDYEEDIA